MRAYTVYPKLHFFYSYILPKLIKLSVHFFMRNAFFRGLPAYAKLYKLKPPHTELKLLCYRKALMTDQQDTSQQIILWLVLIRNCLDCGNCKNDCKLR